MNSANELNYGEPQTVAIQLKRETFSNELNVSYTRGFVSSQAFVDRYQKQGGIQALLPSKADEGLIYKPTHPKEKEALPWMGFEARGAILELLDKAIGDESSIVRVVAYELNVPDIVDRLEKLGNRLKIIIDDSVDHGLPGSAESQAEKRLSLSTQGQVKRQHMGQLQHNKTIVVKGAKINAAICGSTNFAWRGLYVQANNALVVYGEKTIQPFLDAFENYWNYNSAKDFGKTRSATWNDLSLTGIDAKITFSPHGPDNAMLDEIAKDLENGTTSNIFYSLAFLYQTSGSIRETIEKLTKEDKYFIYGISDRKVGGIILQKPSGNRAPVYPSALSKNLPEPFKSEPTGGGGIRMHHKFVVVDFNKPTARVYLGSYNFSPTADTSNGENLLLIRDRKIATSYMIEALRIFDHYHFRVTEKEAKQTKMIIALSRPPREDGEEPWWAEYYSDIRKIRDRELFS